MGVVRKLYDFKLDVISQTAIGYIFFSKIVYSKGFLEKGSILKRYVKAARRRGLLTISNVISQNACFTICRPFGFRHQLFIYLRALPSLSSTPSVCRFLPGLTIYCLIFLPLPPTFPSMIFLHILSSGILYTCRNHWILLAILNRWFRL